jgi:adenine-specific DNA-methyltransferase
MILNYPEVEHNSVLLDYAIEITHEYRNSHSGESRKRKGQFFTSKNIAYFMASLFNTASKSLRILDPGSGTGILLAALCDRIISESNDKLKVTIDCYETDSDVIPSLKKVLNMCEDEFKIHGHEIELNLLNQDFILNNNRTELQNNIDYDPLDYDFIISNPPYYKIRKASPESLLVKDWGLNPPNIYALFMVFSGMMLKNDGEMVFIVPRSFCSGLYYKQIRKWLIENLHFDNIHLFDSRRNVFEHEDVLQENIIFKATNNHKNKSEITLVSHSHDSSFSDYTNLEVSNSDIVFSKNSECYIRIPASDYDLKLMQLIDNWEYTLHDLGLEISTGPVVDFRTRDNLRLELTEDSVPLLWMHNLKGLNVSWPTTNNKKEKAIELNKSTEGILVNINNYVLLKRFTSKEQKHRLDSAVLLKSQFEKFNRIGLENHLNYIYRKEGSLSKFEAYGLAAVLKNTLVDSYFRALNGSTQVNASEIRTLPLPSMKIIEDIGKYIVNTNFDTNNDIDDIIIKFLNISVI